jgi:pantoate--beta-alanine ligase
MRIIHSITEMQAIARTARNDGKTIALVPTMGYLHAGHASLLQAGRMRADLLVASIFVNPTQFGVGEDFNSYPRDLERDCQLAETTGVDYIFAPLAAAMYPAGYQTYVDVEELTKPLCGASRPGHFRGVTTVVAKLFNIVMPHLAFFGKKDYQQLAVIRRMTADLNMDVEIVGMPLIREADGLAMSSRNAYLDENQRASALCLSRALGAAQSAYLAGEHSVAVLRDEVLRVINAVPEAQIDYVEFLDGDSLAGLEVIDDRTLLALAVKIGPVRLIDNRIMGEE